MDNERKYTGLGLLLGIFLSGLWLVLYVSTGEILYLTFTGASIAIGLGLGAAYDRSRKQTADGHTKDDGAQ